MILRCCAAFAVAMLCAVPWDAGAAQGDYPPVWPASDLTFTVPFDPVSEMDAFFPLLEQGIAQGKGKKISARHVPGRGGANAWARILDDAPDGTMLTPVFFPDVHLRALQPDSGVSPSGMSVCHIVAYMPCVLWAAGDNALTSLDSFADAAIRGSGGYLVAGPGSFSAGQLAARMLDRQLGVRTTYIPYSGTVTAAKAVLGGKAGVFWGYSVPVSVPGASRGVLRPLAVAAESRLSSLPGVPTFRELGLEVVLGVYVGIAVPPDTPEITRREIDEFFVEFVKSPAFINGAVSAGFVPTSVAMDGMGAFLAEMRENAALLAERYGLFDQ